MQNHYVLIILSPLVQQMLINKLIAGLFQHHQVLNVLTTQQLQQIVLLEHHAVNGLVILEEV